MLIVVYPGKRHGHQFKAGESLVQGTVGYIAGMNTDGYYTIKAPSNSTTAAVSVYPFKKYYYPEDLSDTADAVNNIASGDPLVVYEGGEYITDKFMITGSGAIGTGTSSPYYRTYFMLDSSYNPPAATDTAAYTEGAGKIVYLWPSTATGYKGWLRIATATDTKVAGNLAQFNRNYLLVRAYSGSYTSNNRVQFKVIAPNFNGMFNRSATAIAFYNVSTL